MGEIGQSEGALAAVRKLRAKVLLLDEQISIGSGLELLGQLCSLSSPTKVLLMTNSIDRQQSIRALRQGARGVIAKYVDDAVFRKAVHCVDEGEIWADRSVLAAWAQSGSPGSDHV